MASLQVTLSPTPSTTPQSVPGFIAGGGFDARLKQAQAPLATPKLPGGHHYMASDFAFTPIEQQSIKGKVNKIAGLLLGGFDPVCKNVAREQARTRAQQIADGYTANDLQRMSREHHCQ